MPQNGENELKTSLLSSETPENGEKMAENRISRSHSGELGANSGDIALNGTEIGPKSPENSENGGENAPKTAVSPYLLGFHLGILVLITAGERVALKIMIDRMDSYLFFILQLIALVYIPLFFFAVFLKKRYRPLDIPPSNTQFPKSSFALMALFDTLSGLITLFAGARVGGGVMTVLMQGVIPVTMLVSYFLLKTRYKRTHLLGAAVIVAGVAVTVAPEFGGGGTNPLYALFFLSSALPTALSNTYKESSLKAIEMDIYYLNAWVALFQFGMGIPLAPLAAVFQGIPVKNMPSNLVLGVKCAIFGRGNEEKTGNWADFFRNSTKMDENGPKMDEYGSEMLENGSKMAENGSKMAENGSKTAKISSKSVKFTQNGSKMAQIGSKMGEKTALGLFSAVFARFSKKLALFSAISAPISQNSAQISAEIAEIGRFPPENAAKTAEIAQISANFAQIPPRFAQIPIDFAQIDPKTPKFVSKTPKFVSKSPKMAENDPKTLKFDPKTPKMASKTPKMASKPPKTDSEPPKSHEMTDSGCRSARLATFLYFALNIGLNVYMLMVMRLGSAVVMVGGSTIAVPLSAALFAVRPLVGASFQRFSWFDVAGIIILTIGVVIYRLKPEGGEEETKTENDAEKRDSVDLGIEGTPLLLSVLPPLEDEKTENGGIYGDL